MTKKPKARERGRVSLTIKEVQGIIERVSYKPGWNLGLHGAVGCPCGDEDECSHMELVGTYKAKDATGTSEQEIMLIGGVPYPSSPLRTEEDVLWWVEKLLLNAEQHEFEEWFKLDGRCVHNPHPEKR